jgi:hypothetical protein
VKRETQHVLLLPLGGTPLLAPATFVAAVGCAVAAGLVLL